MKGDDLESALKRIVLRHGAGRNPEREEERAFESDWLRFAETIAYPALNRARRILEDQGLESTSSRQKGDCILTISQRHSTEQMGELKFSPDLESLQVVVLSTGRGAGPMRINMDDLTTSKVEEIIIAFVAQSFEEEEEEEESF